MSLRQFPLKKTFSNLCFNLRHFKPTRERPTFRSQQHAFCTNSQLLEASCSTWLKQVSSELPSKIFSRLNEEYPEGGEYCGDDTKPLKAARGTFSADKKHSDSTLEYRESSEEFRNDQKNTILRLLNLAEMRKMDILESTIQNLKEEDPSIFTPELINLLFKQSMSNLPKSAHSKYIDDLEMPLYVFQKRLHYNSELYTYFEETVPYWYRIYKQNEELIKHSSEYQSNYIWICYHMDDIITLQKLTYFYLKNKVLNYRVLSYIVGSYLGNFEVQFTKTLFHGILAQGTSFDAAFLELTVRAFIKADSLFENIISLIDLWKASSNCEKPNVQTMSLILAEHHKYADKEELEKFQEYLTELGYNDHPLIRQTNLQYAIIKRNYNSIKKTITNKDIESMHSIISSCGADKDLLNIIYTEFIVFFTKYSDLKMVDALLCSMNHDSITPSRAAFVAISRYFASHQKYFPLIAYLQTICGKIPFGEVYLDVIHKGFVNTFPYYGEVFTKELHRWVNDSEHFTDKEKERYLRLLRISKLESKMSPYGFFPKYLDSKKYDSEQWKPIVWKKDNKGTIIKVSDQVDFRINTGFKQLLRKGVRPDFKELENTFKRSNHTNRRKLLQIAKAIRISTPQRKKLDILELQQESSAFKIAKFSKKGLDSLNSNNRITLSRVSINKGLYEIADTLLSGISPTELDNKTKLMKLNLQLRNYLARGLYDEMDITIKNFAVDRANLSPYIREQCCYIEKKLHQKMRVERYNLEKLHEIQNHPEYTNDISRTADIDNSKVKSFTIGDASTQVNRISSLASTIEHIRGLIGDIELRLEKDKDDIEKSMKSLFIFLTKWLEQDKDHRRL